MNIKFFTIDHATVASSVKETELDHLLHNGWRIIAFSGGDRYSRFVLTDN